MSWNVWKTNTKYLKYMINKKVIIFVLTIALRAMFAAAAAAGVCSVQRPNTGYFTNHRQLLYIVAHLLGSSPVKLPIKTSNSRQNILYIFFHQNYSTQHVSIYSLKKTVNLRSNFYSIIRRVAEKITIYVNSFFSLVQGLFVGFFFFCRNWLFVLHIITGLHNDHCTVCSEILMSTLLTFSRVLTVFPFTTEA